MTEEEYKAEWKLGFHQTDYNNCRFAEDKVQYCKDWIDKHCKDYHSYYLSDVCRMVCDQKIKIATDANYRALCQDWSDKINARAMLINEGMENLSIPTLTEKYDNIKVQDLMNLDQSKPYIVKCNHGSGWNKTKTETNSVNTIQRDIRAWQNLNYAYIAGYEAQYENIKPGFLVQPVLCDKPIDYGFWYVQGELQNISLTKKYGKNLEEYLAFVKPDCTASKFYIGIQPEMGNLPTKFAYAAQTLREYTDQLAKPFDFVRVDMFFVNKTPYFGEMTFTPCAGRIEVMYK